MRAFDGVGGCGTVHQVGKWTCDQRVTLTWLTLLCPRARRLTRFAWEKMDQWISYVRTLWSSVECTCASNALTLSLQIDAARGTAQRSAQEHRSQRQNQSVHYGAVAAASGASAQWCLERLRPQVRHARPFHRQNFTDEMCRNMIEVGPFVSVTDESI